jgi:hypothetical protein
MNLLVILMLGGKQLLLHQWMTSFKHKIGTTGLSSDRTHDVTHTSLTLQNQFYSHCLLPFLQGSGEATMAADIKSKLRPPKQRSVNDPTETKS